MTRGCFVGSSHSSSRSRDSASAALVSFKGFFWSTLSSWNISPVFRLFLFLLRKPSIMFQAESESLRNRCTVAPWWIITFQCSSFKRCSRLFPTSATGPSISHNVVARTTFFALPGPVSSVNMRRLWWGIEPVRGSVICCTYTIPDSSIFFLYLFRYGYRDSMCYEGLTRRTFSSAMRQSVREFPRRSGSSRIPVCQ